MRRSTVLAVIAAAIVVVGASAPSAVAQQGQQMGPGMGMGTGMGPDMMGPGGEHGMMGRGMGGMMGMGGGGCPMMGMMGRDGDMPMYREGRIAFLKAELAITDAQTKVWDGYADALKKNMQSMQDMRATMMAARSGKTPVERLDAHITAMEGRLQALKGTKPALGALYDALSDEQKKTADQLLTGMGCMM